MKLNDNLFKNILFEEKSDFFKNNVQTNFNNQTQARAHIEGILR